MAASPPGYRVQFSGAVDEDQCLGPAGERHDARVDRNASLASDHVGAYISTLLVELAEIMLCIRPVQLVLPAS